MEISFNWGGRTVVANRPMFDPRIEDIRRRLHAGETLEQIGAVHGVTRERIRQIAKNAGIAWARRIDIAHERRQIREAARKTERRIRRAARDEKLAQARALVESGMSIRKACEAAGFTLSQMNQLAVGKGWPTRHGRHRHELKEQHVKIIPLYQSGIPAWCIAEMFGVRCFNVRSFLRRHGVELRPERKPIIRPPKEPKQPNPRPSKYQLSNTPRKPQAHRAIVPHDLGQCRKWRDDQLALLAERWNAGASASVIAAELGPPFTRNAVIGQVFRQRRRAAANEARAA